MGDKRIDEMAPEERILVLEYFVGKDPAGFAEAASEASARYVRANGYQDNPGARTTTEYAVRYTERSAFNGREYMATSAIGSGDAPDLPNEALALAERTREYQTREGLPVDAMAVACTVSITPWAPVSVPSGETPNA